MTGRNQLRKELKADGASGTRNKNSRGVILTFVATERQVVGANVKSSVRMWRRRKTVRAAELRSGRRPVIAGQPMIRTSSALKMFRYRLHPSSSNKKGALSARLKCFSGNDPLSGS
jgi:hypothetical protein